MASRRRIRQMIRLAEFRQENQNSALRVVRYSRGDYIALSLLKNFLLTTIAFFLMAGLFALYHVEFVVSNLNDLRFDALVLTVVVAYVMMLAVFSVVTYIFARIRYDRAEESVKEYREGLKRLEYYYRRKTGKDTSFPEEKK